MASQQARRVLRDINGWFEHLLEIPDQELQPFVFKAIFLKNGWPSEHFDIEGLQIDRERARAAASAAYDLKENDLDAKVEAAQTWANHRSGLDHPNGLDSMELETLKERIKKAEIEDEKWLVEWELKGAEDLQKLHTNKLQQAIQARHNAGIEYWYNRPEDQILGEVRKLQEEL